MIGTNIKKIRELRGLSINSLAKKCNMSAGYLSDIEKNKKENPSMDILKSIADVLKVTVEELFKEEIKEDDISNKVTFLESIPIKFTSPEEARTYVERHQIFGSDGFDPDKLDDEEIVEFANALLEQMKMVSYKYKK